MGVCGELGVKLIILLIINSSVRQWLGSCSGARTRKEEAAWA
jgi:hypothetical protein